MGINAAAALFGLKPGEAATPFKNTVIEQAEVFRPVKKQGGAGPAGDSVEVSELAKALTGKAAELFNALDPKVREQLDGLVKGKQISAKDVVLALQAEATAALFNRYTAEMAPDEDQLAISRRLGELDASQITLWNDPSSEYRTPGDDEAPLSPAQRVAAMFEPGRAKPAVGDESGRLMESYLSRTLERFKTLDLGADDHRGQELVSREAQDAQKRLSALLEKTGIDWKRFAYDTKRYANSVNMPEIGRGAPLPEWEQRTG